MRTPWFLAAVVLALISFACLAPSSEAAVPPVGAVGRALEAEADGAVRAPRARFAFRARVGNRVVGNHFAFRRAVVVQRAFVPAFVPSFAPAFLTPSFSQGLNFNAFSAYGAGGISVNADPCAGGAALVPAFGVSGHGAGYGGGVLGNRFVFRARF